MPHRSRVCSVLFDTTDVDYETTAHFWAGALGRTVEFDPRGRYARLMGALDYTVQRVAADHVGVHIDIETDNVAAEVARLEALGARRKYPIKTWWVLEDPGGHAFCVVPVQSQTWPDGATEWPDPDA